MINKQPSSATFPTLSRAVPHRLLTIAAMRLRFPPLRFKTPQSQSLLHSYITTCTTHNQTAHCYPNEIRNLYLHLTNNVITSTVTSSVLRAKGARCARTMMQIVVRGRDRVLVVWPPHVCQQHQYLMKS